MNRPLCGGPVAKIGAVETGANKTSAGTFRLKPKSLSPEMFRDDTHQPPSGRTESGI